MVHFTFTPFTNVIKRNNVIHNHLHKRIIDVVLNHFGVPDRIDNLEEFQMSFDRSGLNWLFILARSSKVLPLD